MILTNHCLDSASLGCVNRLRLELRTLGTHAARRVHGRLQRISLPAEDIVGVLTQAGGVAGAEDEWLLVIVLGGWPQRLVVELGGVPDDLVHQLRDPDRVGRRAGSAQAQEGGRSTDGVRDVVFVIGGVKILAVPAAVTVALDLIIRLV